jgi:hypothetical protein
MSIHTFFKSLTSTPTRRRPIHRRPPASRLCLETLEDRCLLSFGMPLNYGADLAAQSLASADFNGDGRLDLATANYFDNTVSVLLGNGDGTFQAPRTSAAGTAYSTLSLVTADLNRDGKTDLVTLNYNSTNMSLLLGNGDGTFQAPQSVVLPAQLPPGWTGPDPLDQYLNWNGSDPLAQYVDAVAIGDMNGDGKLDIVAAGSTGYTTVTYVWLSDPVYENHVDHYVNVLLGNGDGTFGPGNAHHVDFWADPLFLGDFHGDGRLDVVTSSGGQLKLLRGNGDGTLQDAQSSFTTVGFGSVSNPVGDFDRDGKVDLLMMHPYYGAVVMLGNGDGTFRRGNSIELGTAWTAAVVGNINADGKLDIVRIHNDVLYTDDYPSATTRSAQVLLGYGDGTFSSPIIVDLGTVPTEFTSFVSPVLADFDGDGFPDLAATEYHAPESGYFYSGVHVALNDGLWPAPAPRASSFVISGFPSPATAGTAGAFTVTAKDASGNTLTNYSGKVHFTSSDAEAGLPNDYSFTTADQGMHTFSPILKTAGTQSLTVTELANTSVTATQAGITVNPAAASRFTFDGFIYVTAGANSFTVTAQDPYGNRATGYTGTVRLTCSDAKAVLPGNYTFSAADAGMHAFSVMLKTAGWQSLTVTDTANPAITGTDSYIDVWPAAASRLVLSAPANVKANAQFNLTVTVVDAYGNVVTGYTVYTGTLSFRSSDATANLPRSYTFTAADQGVHTFPGLRLKKRGKQTITVTDALNSSITGSLTINVI